MSDEIPPYFKVLDDLLFRFHGIVSGMAGVKVTEWHREVLDTIHQEVRRCQKAFCSI